MAQIHKEIATNKIFFSLFSFCLITALLLFVGFQSPIFLVIPIAFIVLFLALVDFKKVYLLFFILLPFSIEIYFESGLGADLPADPLMWLLTLVGIVWMTSHFKDIQKAIFRSPITLLLILHLFWIFLTALGSMNPVVSLKFIAAKVWYVVPFYFLPAYLLNSQNDYKQLIKYLWISLSFAIIYVLVRHGTSGFAFNSINSAVSPIFRNHVNYACIIVISIPLLWLYFKWKYSQEKKIWIQVILFSFVLIALYLSYTRVVLVALILAVLALGMIRYKLLKTALLSFVILTMFAAVFLIRNNQYLRYAPNYERTIAHERFDNLMQATYKMEDISIMERVYRWVAGYYMLKERPFWGFGPGTFYSNYKPYTVSSFKTYVSDNPDKSGIHNYYLMTAVEQGFIGLGIFILLILVAFFRGLRLIEVLKPGFRKDLVYTAMAMLIIICSIILINDMIEAAKVGPFFFLALSIIGKSDGFFSVFRG